MIGDLWETISGWVSGGWDGPLPVVGALAGVWWQTGGRSGRRRKTTRDLLALYNELPEKGWSAERDLLERRLRGEISQLGLRAASEQPRARSAVPRLALLLSAVLAALVAAAAFADQLDQIAPGVPDDTLQVVRGALIGLSVFATTAAMTSGLNQLADKRRAEQAYQLRKAFVEAQTETVEKSVAEVDRKLRESLS